MLAPNRRFPSLGGPIEPDQASLNPPRFEYRPRDGRAYRQGAPPWVRIATAKT
jgi:hypothetical protein